MKRVCVCWGGGVQMVGRGGLSHCGEEREVQLSASHPVALTLCVSFHRLAPSHYDKLHIASLSQHSSHPLPPKDKKKPTPNCPKLGSPQR